MLGKKRGRDTMIQYRRVEEDLDFNAHVCRSWVLMFWAFPFRFLIEGHGEVVHDQFWNWQPVSSYSLLGSNVPGQ